MKLLIDANILLDVLQNREPHVQASSVVWKLCETEKAKGFNVSDLAHAAKLDWDDFEDAVQSVTAERVHADYIITRNVRDFGRSKVVAFTPSELIARI